MNPRLLLATVFIATLGCALISGVFFAFSSFVMRALLQLPASHGLQAMQSINIVVINRWFLGAFLGTAGCCVLVALASLGEVRTASALLRVAASALYLAGVVGVTAACNVPLNDGLAEMTDAAAAAEWPRFVSEWSRWNHVRTVAALLASALFLISIQVERRGSNL